MPTSGLSFATCAASSPTLLETSQDAATLGGDCPHKVIESGKNSRRDFIRRLPASVARAVNRDDGLMGELAEGEAAVRAAAPTDPCRPPAPNCRLAI